MVKIKVFIKSKRGVEKKYGKGTKAVTFFPGKGKSAKHIVLSKSLKSKQRKRTLSHEIGHFLTNKPEVKRRIPEKEKKLIRKFGRAWAAKGRLKSKREELDEGLAELYSSKRLGRSRRTSRNICKLLPKTEKEFDKLKRRRERITFGK